MESDLHIGGSTGWLTFLAVFQSLHEQSGTSSMCSERCCVRFVLIRKLLLLTVFFPWIDHIGQIYFLMYFKILICIPPYIYNYILFADRLCSVRLQRHGIHKVLLRPADLSRLLAGDVHLFTTSGRGHRGLRGQYVEFRYRTNADHRFDIRFWRGLLIASHYWR